MMYYWYGYHTKWFQCLLMAINEDENHWKILKNIQNDHVLRTDMVKFFWIVYETIWLINEQLLIAFFEYIVE